MPLPILVMAFIIGAIVGSFLNVVGLRFLRNESIVWPGSHCYACKAPIKPYDNIPVLSWLVLGGKCRACKAGISWQYPVVELLTALLFTATVYTFGITWQTAFFLALIANLVVILITDFREQFIYDLNSIGLIPIGLAYTGFNIAHMPGGPVWHLGALTLAAGPMFISAVLAVVGAFVIFFILNLISRLLVGNPGFGEGDTRLLMGVGAFFGIQAMVIVFILSFAIQAAFGIPMLLWQWARSGAYTVLAMLSGAIVLAILPYAAQFVVSDPLLILAVSLVSGLIAMVLALKALKMAKELPMGLTYLPFGPAIVFGCLLIMFFGTPITATVRHIFLGS